MSRSTSSTRSRFLGVLFVLALAAVGVAGWAGPAQAVVYYWDVTSPIETAGFGTAGGTWGTNLYWSASSAGTDTSGILSPGAGDDLNFGYLTTGLAAGTVSVTGTVNAQSLTFASGSGAIVLSGGTAINLAAAATITTNNAADTISSALTGAGTSLTKAGTGTLTLSGANTYTGATTLSAGTLSVGATANLGAAASNLVFDGGTLQITGTMLTNFSGIGHTVVFNAGKTVGLDINTAANIFTAGQVLNQTTGGLTKSGAGTLILNQANTYTGATTISAGTLSINTIADWAAVSPTATAGWSSDHAG